MNLKKCNGVNGTYSRVGFRLTTTIPVSLLNFNISLGMCNFAEILKSHALVA